MNWRKYNGLFLAAGVVLASPRAVLQQGLLLAHPGPAEGEVDLTRATIVTPPTLTVPERTAVRVLVEEIERRTTIRLPGASQWSVDTQPARPIDTAAPHS